MTAEKITAVHCDALSYSGTTWLNLVLGNHEKAFTIGPPHRFWELRDKNFKGACLVHGPDCEFWKGFDEFWNRTDNLLVALAAYSGKTHFLFDNPPPEFVSEVMEDTRIDVKRVRYVRDARAISASYARRFEAVSFYDSILPDGWLYHSLMAIQNPEDDPDNRYVHYEKCAQDTGKFVHEISEYIGLIPRKNAHHFWEGDHHITVGNMGPINMVKMHQGLRIPDFESKELYQAQYERLLQEPDKSFFDERWKTQLTRQDLFYFDLLMGAKNEALGYKRDTFLDEEIIEFWVRYGAEVHEGTRKPLPVDAMQSGQVLYNQAVANMPVIETVRQQPLAQAAGEAPTTPEVSMIEDITPFELPPYPQTTAVTRFRQENPDSVIPANTSTTTYFDTVDPGRLAAKKPYKVAPSALDEAAIDHIVNYNMFIAYGPTYKNKNIAHISMDPLTRYRDLLVSLKANPNIIFRTHHDALINPPEDGEIICLIRHDVDGDLNAAVDMARVEQALDIKSSYYLLHTAPYYAMREGNIYKRNESSLNKYKSLQDMGHEVAIHTDALTLYEYEDINGADAIVSELNWLRHQGLNITGTLAHNSFGQYGANNYSVFKERPLNLHEKGGPVAVEHNGRWAPLRELDETQLGLEYEGNDVYWQTETPLEYYCLMNQSLWYKQSNLYGRLLPKGPRPQIAASWMSQDMVVDDCLNMQCGRYLVLVVHPLHYGLRAESEKPLESCARGLDGDIFDALMTPAMTDAAISSREVEVEFADTNETVTVHAGLIGDHLESISMLSKNELGTADRPLSQLAEGHVRVMFAGGKNFATHSVPVDSKVAQMTARLLRIGIKNRATVSASAIAKSSLTAQDIEACLADLSAEQMPQILILGLSERHLSENSELIDYANSIAGKSVSVFGLVEQDDYDLAHNGANGIIGDQEDLTARLREKCIFQIFNPYALFVNHSGSGKLYWKSSQDWSYHAHYVSARLLAEGITDFVRTAFIPEG